MYDEDPSLMTNIYSTYMITLSEGGLFSIEKY